MKQHTKLSALSVVSLSLILLLCNCAPIPIARISPIHTLTDYLNNQDYPHDFWETSTPLAQGMNEDSLEHLVKEISDKNYEIHSLLIIKNGFLVFERYGNSFTPDAIHNLNSSTKSVVSALFGIAINQGYVSGIKDKMLTCIGNMSIKNMSPEKENITIEDLLDMRSGLEWNDEQIIMEYLNAENAVQYILDRPMVAAPNKEWHYNSGSSHLLSAIITKTTGKPTAVYARNNLFTPLGIRNYFWTMDKQNINLGGLGLALTPRDMAKFGYLYLNKGKWKNEQIIPEDWVSTSTSAHSDTYWGSKFGYHWWIKNDDCFASQGAFGQNIFIYPKKNIVIVYTAGLPVDKADAILLQLTSDYIIPAIND
jgi:CubicO group peptidase (beta-lactamase class C family)